MADFTTKAVTIGAFMVFGCINTIGTKFQFSTSAEGDDGGQDEKILAVPATRLHPFYSDVVDYTDLPPILLEQIHHFFSHYKDLEEGKWVKVRGWGDRHQAGELIETAIARHQDS